MQPATDLPVLLADAGIRLKRLTPGHSEQIRCPRCDGGRTREVSLTVTIDADGDGATWLCHRGSCGWADGARVHRDDPAPQRERVIRQPEPQRETRPEWLYEFFAERRIGARTMTDLGIYGARRWFPPIGERPAIVFPYRFDGDVVNRKYRPHPDKAPQQQEKDALRSLYNVDSLGAEPAEIVWVEGEPDVAALWECGIRNAVTLPDGAPQEARFKPDDRRFEALRTHAELLARPKRMVLAGDSDGPGLALREELARRLGRHRCHIVNWPTGCKDACDVLRRDGPDAVVAAIRAAEPYPIDGLQRIKRGTLVALRHTPPPATMTTGARATDGVLKLPAEGRLIILTGVPSHGKSSWARFVMVHTALNHDRHWAVFSPEMQPWEQFVASCAEVYSGKPFWPVAGIESMTDPEIADAEAWLADRVTMLVCDSEDEAPTLEWLIERFRAAVLRDGVTDVVIDPWNEVEHARERDVTETEYIGRSLQRLKAFGLRHGCNVWVIAHPAKPWGLKPGEKRGAPGPYDINGSAHWANKADLGLTVYSPNPGGAEIHLWKARFRRWGQRSSIGSLDYDVVTGRYSTPITQLAAGPAAPAWTEADR